MYSSAYVWAKILNYLEEHIGSTLVSGSVDDAEVVELNDTNLILFSPSEIRRSMILRLCKPYIEDAL